MTDSKIYNEKAFDEIFKNKEIIDYTNYIGKTGRRDKKVMSALKEFGMKNRQCLDVGPGTGRWLQYLTDHGASYLAAIDVSQESLDRCSKLCDKIQKADVEKEKFDFDNEQFDIVISFMILEHLRNPDNYLSEIIRVTKRGGMILLTIPNIVSFVSRIRAIFGIMPQAITADNTHVRFYTMRELKKIFLPFKLAPVIIPTSFSLNPFNTKTFRIPTNKFLRSLDDHILIKICKPD